MFAENLSQPPWLRQWIIIYIYPVISCLQMEESSCPVVSIGDQSQIERRYLRSKHRIEMDRVNSYPYWILMKADIFLNFFFFIVKFSYIRSLTTIGRKKKKKTSSFWGRLQSLVVSSATNLLFFQKNSIFISLFATRYKNIFEKKIIQKNSLW